MVKYKKKLLVFIPSIEDGGVEKNLFLILNHLCAKIDNINLVTFDEKTRSKFKKKIKILNPFFNFSFIRGRYPKYILCLLLFLKLVLFDRNYVIFSFQANIFVIILSKILNLKVISRSNSSSAGWSKNPIKQIIFSFFFKRADTVIVNSYDFKKEMDKKYKINCRCILNPFDFKHIKKKSKMKVKKIFKKDSLKLISVGRLTEQKDFITSLKAINLIKEKKIELILMGKGYEEKKLKKYVYKNNLEKKIKFIGYKKNPFPYIKQADIFLLTSTFEGSPNVLVEALFLKKFIISTDCPTGPNEILNKGKYGCLVKVKDYKSIAKEIKNFKNKKKILKKKIENGFKSLKDFDYTKNCESYFNLVNKYL